jgi:hypothetical protein
MLRSLQVRGAYWVLSQLALCSPRKGAGPQTQFLAWAERAGYQDLEDIEPITVAAYIEILQRLAAPPTVKQHMAAIRMLFSWLTEKGVLAMDPAREVKTERFSRTEGKTPAFVEGEVQRLLGVIETSDFWSTTLQSGGGYSVTPRALLGVLAYTFARIGAVCEFLLIQKKFVAAPNKWQLVNPLAPRRYGSGVQVLVADPQDPQERFYAEAGQCIRRYLTKHQNRLRP